MRTRRRLLICLLAGLGLPGFGLSATGGGAEVAPSPELSVEERLRLLDTDHDGQVSMSEIRAYLEAQHGKGFEASLLSEMEKKGNPSCSSPFSRSLY